MSLLKLRQLGGTKEEVMMLRVIKGNVWIERHTLSIAVQDCGIKARG
jgi:hypothetical protein